MLKRLATAIWGEFDSREELQKFLILAVIFGLIIGVYWSMRPIKDSIFNAVVGGEWIWLAKIVSLLVISPLVIVYGKLIDMYPRQKVFYGLIALYALLAFFFMWQFADPVNGLYDKVAGLGDPNANPHRYMGWGWYVYVESFGSLIVALFWAITVDTTKPESAKRGFPLVVLVGQIGNIIGPRYLQANVLGFGTSAPILGILGALMLVTGIMFWVFMAVTPENQLVGYETKDHAEKHSEPGFLEGLKLLFSQAYLLGMFFIIFFYELIITVIDYHFKQTVFETYPVAQFGEAVSAGYLSGYAEWVGWVATACVLFGVNNIQRRLGITVSLVLLPILVTIAVCTLYFYPTSLNIIMWIMVFSKAINYALNGPTMKQLYIPTTQDTKYKAQAWIEMFGSRGSKATSSSFNSFRSAWGVPSFMLVTLLGSCGIIAAWLFIAVYVSKKYNTAIAQDKVVC